MAILVSLKKQLQNDIPSVNTIFRNIDVNKKNEDDENPQYTKKIIKQLLGGKINDMAITNSCILISSENVDSIKIDGDEEDFDYLWNQAVSISFNQPFYGNVFISLIDDLDIEYVKELEEEFIMNDFTADHQPNFLSDLKTDYNFEKRTRFYLNMIDEMLEMFHAFMKNIKNKVDEMLINDDFENFGNDLETFKEASKNDYIKVLEYDHTSGEEFFDDILNINENCFYILYSQLSKIPLDDIKTILEVKSALNLELDSKNKIDKYDISIKGDKKVLDEFANILLKHFEISENYEFCVVLKKFQTYIENI